jgi:hypothetical protein
LYRTDRRAGCERGDAGPGVEDSAWVRTKRALTAEVFTLDVQDSMGVCEQDRKETLDRILQVVAPATN